MLSHTLIISYYVDIDKHAVQDNQGPKRAGHHRPSLLAPARHLYTHYIPSQLTSTYKSNATTQFVLVSAPNQKSSLEKAMPTLKDPVLIPRPVSNWQTYVSVPWESISSHPPQSYQRHSAINLHSSLYAVDDIYGSLILHTIILVSMQYFFTTIDRTSTMSMIIHNRLQSKFIKTKHNIQINVVWE